MEQPLHKRVYTCLSPHEVDELHSLMRSGEQRAQFIREAVFDKMAARKAERAKSRAADMILKMDERMATAS